MWWTRTEKTAVEVDTDRRRHWLCSELTTVHHLLVVPDMLELLHDITVVLFPTTGSMCERKWCQSFGVSPGDGTVTEIGMGGGGTTAVSFPYLNTDPLIRILSTEVVSNSIKPTTSSGSPAVVLVWHGKATPVVGSIPWASLTALFGEKQKMSLVWKQGFWEWAWQCGFCTMIGPTVADFFVITYRISNI